MIHSGIDLGPACGLAVRLDGGTGELSFGDVASAPPGTRLAGELRAVLRDPAADERQVVYRFYRGVHRIGNESALSAVRLRYDLVVTLPGTVGSERTKTAGHYHRPAEGGGSFPEIYQVVHGTAAFVVQRVDDVMAAEPRVERVWVQVCRPGESIVIPPDCGHVTVNAGAVPLVVANLVSTRCEPLYDTFRTMRGAACHVLAGNTEAELRLAANPAYARAPSPIVSRGSRSGPFMVTGRPLYSHLLAAPARFAFLDHAAELVPDLAPIWQTP